jgi:hypothetical protein
MKKILSISLPLLFITFSIALCSCKSVSSKTNSKQAPESSQLTIEDVKKKYTDTKIKDIREINKNFVLVESQQETWAHKFDVINLKTGELDTLPTMPEFVTLEDIESENSFIFLASGKNCECPFGSFPYRIKCVRVKNDKKDQSNFIAIKEEKYFKLDESVESGSKSESILSAVVPTLNGFQVLFKPIPGKEDIYYADASDIPPTKTTYNKENKELIFQIDTVKLDGSLKLRKKLTTPDSIYFNFIVIEENNGKINIIVSLIDNVDEYIVRNKRLPNKYSYLEAEFHINGE